MVAWPAGRSVSGALLALALAAFLAVGLVGTYRYVDNFWLYRGFAPPRDAAFVTEAGATQRLHVASAALGGRSQPVDVYLPPGYARHPQRGTPCSTSCTASPAGRVRSSRPCAWASWRTSSWHCTLPSR